MITSESSEMLQSAANLNSTGSGQSWKWNNVFSYNFRQNIADKFMKLSNFLQFSNAIVKTCLLDAGLVLYLPSIQAFKGFVWNSLIS